MDIGLNINILQWNIQGFFSHKFALEVIIARHKPNIIALQETHIVDKNRHLLHLPGFNIYHHNKNYQNAKSGVALLVSKTMNVIKHTKSSGSLLYQTITIKGAKNLNITNIYKECDVILTSSMVRSINTSIAGHHLVIGDLNSQNPLWGSNSLSPCGTIWEEFSDDRNLVILNDGSPTLLNTRNTLTMVDVSMASTDIAANLNWKTLALPEVGDHFPINIFNNINVIKKQFIPMFRDKHADWLKFKVKVTNTIDEFEESTNINKEAAQLKKIIRKSANESIPLSRKPSEKNSPIWFNSEIAKLTRLKQIAWKTFRRNRSSVNALNFRRACSIVKRECRNAKRLTWTNFLNSLNPNIDSRVLWTKVKNIRSDRITNFPVIYHADDVIQHPQEISNKFAQYWCSIGSDSTLNSDIVTEKQNFIFNENVPNRYPQMCEIISLSELNEVLRNAKGTTPSLDKITYSMIKNAPTIFKQRLCNLYNNILESGIYPHDWKVAVLSPIPKPGKNPNQLEGYRPISLLPVLSKILEKIISARFWKHTKHQISKNQHAFLPKHGVHSLCHLLEDQLRQNLAKRKHSAVLSEDIEKAFDRVVFTFVLKELEEWGTPLQIRKLIKSFLSNRNVLVKIDGYLSQIHGMDNGVPQGSPLSVVLFVIYANSLAKSIESVSGVDYVGIYADNIFAIASGTPKVVETKLKNINDKVQQWASLRGAVVPLNKAEFLHVCRKQHCASQTFTIDGAELQYKKKMRILGIIFSKNLSWNEHVNNLIERIGKINNLLKLICSKKKGPHMETALDICKALTHGLVQHGISIYGWTSKENISKLNTSLNNCFRTASGLLRATPIESLRIETRSSDFNSIWEKISINLFSRSIIDPDESLHQIFWFYLNYPTCKYNCSIKSIVLLSKKYNLPLPKKPTLTFSSNITVSIDAQLAAFSKSKSNPQCFKQMFAEKKSTISPDLVLYTDGSFQDGATSYALVEQTSTTGFTVIKQGLLPMFTGIFTAELTAINEALTYAIEQNCKTLICTDSLSVVNALSKNKKGLYNNILMRPCSYQQVTLLWIPSHIGIPGNENADLAAKQAFLKPLVYEVPFFPKIITNTFKMQHLTNRIQQWQNAQTFLRLHNRSIERPKYHANLSREECVTMARIRVGKALFNTKHYYNNTGQAICSLCHVILDIPHILIECSISKSNDTIEEILNCSNPHKIKLVKECIRKQNINEI